MLAPPARSARRPSKTKRLNISSGRKQAAAGGLAARRGTVAAGAPSSRARSQGPQFGAELCSPKPCHSNTGPAARPRGEPPPLRLLKSLRVATSCRLTVHLPGRPRRNSERVTGHPENACRTHPSADLCTDGRPSARGGAFGMNAVAGGKGCCTRELSCGTTSLFGAFNFRIGRKPGAIRLRRPAVPINFGGQTAQLPK